VLISSAYRRAGLFYERYNAAFGNNDPHTLVVLGTSLQFNPTLDAEAIDAELIKDEAKASAEYLSTWRDDISSLVSREIVDELTDPEQIRPYVIGLHYLAFADEGGGGPGGDASTLCIVHRDANQRVIVDGVWRWPAPFSCQGVIAAKCRILREYHVTKVVGDKWGGDLIPDLYMSNGLSFDNTAPPKSQIYAEFLTILNARGCRLTSDPVLRTELLALERRTRWGGAESIDHPDGQHDDAVNAVAGAVTLAVTAKTLNITQETITQYRTAAQGATRRPYSDVVGKPDSWKTMTPSEKMNFDWGVHSFIPPSSSSSSSRRLYISPAMLARARVPAGSAPSPTHGQSGQYEDFFPGGVSPITPFQK
jgi:hypothetical protein